LLFATFIKIPLNFIIPTPVGILMVVFLLLLALYYICNKQTSVVLMKGEFL